MRATPVGPSLRGQRRRGRPAQGGARGGELRRQGDPRQGGFGSDRDHGRAAGAPARGAEGRRPPGDRVRLVRVFGSEEEFPGAKKIGEHQYVVDLMPQSMKQSFERDERGARRGPAGPRAAGRRGGRLARGQLLDGVGDAGPAQRALGSGRRRSRPRWPGGGRVPAVGLALGEGRGGRPAAVEAGRRRRARAGRRIEAGWRRETLIGERLVRQPRWILVSEPCAVGVITISRC